MENMAILMADLSGYTAMTEIHGPEAAAQMINKYIDLVNSSLAGKSCMLERVGDQVLIVSPNADDIAVTAITLNEKAKKQSPFLPVHAGINYGEVLVQGRNLFGSTMNLTARITAQANAGTILCSARFVEALSMPHAFRFKSTGYIRFKNVLHSMEILEILPTTSKLRQQKVADPVCHLEMNEEHCHYRFKRKNNIYHFCSRHCMNVFQEQSTIRTMALA